MGCWNETCGVTQFPILSGEKIRLFVLTNQALYPNGGGTCYVNDIWAPVGAPIQGEYDDYGGIENIVKSYSNELLLSKLKENWIPFTNKYEDIPSVSDMTLEQALYFIERNYAKAKNKYDVEAQLGIMFVLEDVYQAMVNFNPIICHHNYDSHEYSYKPASQMFQEEMETWYTKMFKHAEAFKDNKDLAAAMIELSSFNDSVIFCSSTDSTNYIFKKPLIALAKASLPYEDVKVQQLVIPILEMIAFESSFVAARKMWIPQCGKGSQQDDIAVYNEINKATKKIVASRKKRYEGRDKPNKQGYYPYMLEHNAKLSKESNGDQKVPTKKTR